MFELLLQADRAVSEGLLDQAERTYWQVVELDPTNAIAVVGLARVSLERGDEQMARMFADRARAMDPENLAARRIIEALDRRIPGGVAAEAPDLPLVAAQRLEALSRRRGAGSHQPEEGAGSVAAASAGPATAATAGGARGVASGSSRGPRSRLRPDPIPQLPSEPLTERRRAGRLAAAAAAAAAAAMQQPAHLPRHEPHHAIPSGRGRVDAEELRAPARDPYAAAEAAAVVEAVDAVDLADEAPASTPSPSADAAAALGAGGPSEEDAGETAPSAEPAAPAQAAPDAPAAGRKKSFFDRLRGG
jgi:hypothetical protein